MFATGARVDLQERAIGEPRVPTIDPLIEQLRMLRSGARLRGDPGFILRSRREIRFDLALLIFRFTGNQS